MFNKGSNFSDLDSVSSRTSNVTSRVTTPAESLGNLSLHDPKNTTMIREFNDQSLSNNYSSPPSTTTGSISTVIHRNDNNQMTNSNRSDISSAGSQQKSWVNPYWGSKANTNTGTNESLTKSPDVNTTLERQPSSRGVKQLIPGSILINDQGEIDDPSWKKKGLGKPNTSTGSVVSEKNLSSANSNSHLPPKSPQHTTPTLAAGLSGFPTAPNGLHRPNSIPNKQQTSSDTVKSAKQPWQNPYWKDSEAKPGQEQNKTWQNPYWKDSEAKPGQEQNNTWQNPYWKDWKAQTNQQQHELGKDNVPKANETSKPTQQQDKAWQNPYWKDWKPQSTEQQDKLSKDEENNNKKSSSLDETAAISTKIPPIPSFYERVYPSDALSSSSFIPIHNPNDDTVLFTGSSKPYTNDADDLAYFINDQGIAHYRADSHSSNIPTSQANVTSSTTMPKLTSFLENNPVNPQSTQDTKIELTKSSPQSTFPSLFNNSQPSVPKNVEHNFSLSSPVTIIAEHDLNSIQNALQLLEKNPNAFINTSAAPPILPVKNMSSADPPSAPLLSMFSGKKEPTPQPASSTTNTAPLDQPQSSLFSLFAGKKDMPLQSTAITNTFRTDVPTSSYPSLFFGKNDQSLLQTANATRIGEPSSLSPCLFSNNNQQLTTATSGYSAIVNELPHKLVKQGKAVLI